MPAGAPAKPSDRVEREDEHLILGSVECASRGRGNEQMWQSRSGTGTERLGPANRSAHAFGASFALVDRGRRDPADEKGHLFEQPTDRLTEHEMQLGQRSDFTR